PQRFFRALCTSFDSLTRFFCSTNSFWSFSPAFFPACRPSGRQSPDSSIPLHPARRSNGLWRPPTGIKHMLTQIIATLLSSRPQAALNARRKKFFPPGKFETLEPRQLLASVTTDQLDYAPGSTAIISGSGFAVGETIHLEVMRTDGLPEGTPDNPWNIIDGVTDGG